jgi:hypothetical protein
MRVLDPEADREEPDIEPVDARLKALCLRLEGSGILARDLSAAERETLALPHGDRLTFEQAGVRRVYADWRARVGRLEGGG